MDRKQYQKEYYLRKKQEKCREERLKDYLDAFGDIKATDLEMIKQLIVLEENLEGMEEQIAELLENKEYKQAIHLISASHDATNFFINLQKTLGIDRLTRLKKHEDYSMIDYLEDLKTKVDPSQRLKKLYCQKHPMCVAKYQLLNGANKYTFEVECPMCSEMAVESCGEELE
jgi:hypothetical protein